MHTHIQIHIYTQRGREGERVMGQTARAGQSEIKEKLTRDIYKIRSLWSCRGRCNTYTHSTHTWGEGGEAEGVTEPAAGTGKRNAYQ